MIHHIEGEFFVLLSWVFPVTFYYDLISIWRSSTFLFGGCWGKVEAFDLIFDFFSLFDSRQYPLYLSDGGRHNGNVVSILLLHASFRNQTMDEKRYDTQYPC